MKRSILKIYVISFFTLAHAMGMLAQNVTDAAHFLHPSDSVQDRLTHQLKQLLTKISAIDDLEPNSMDALARVINFITEQPDISNSDYQEILDFIAALLASQTIAEQQEIELAALHQSATNLFVAYANNGENDEVFATSLITRGAGDFVNGGNSFGASAILGTNDAHSLSFETSGTNRHSISAIGAHNFTSPDSGNTATVTIADGAGTGVALQINGTTAIASGNLDIPATSTTAGVITQNGTRLLHTHNSENTFCGLDAGNVTSTGYGNTGIGFNALTANTTGEVNTAVGAYALLENTTGYGLSAVGGAALFSNTTGTYNTAMGGDALAANTTGDNNSAFGGFALASNTIGSDNTALGYNALSYALASGNTAVGARALDASSFGNNNVAVGKDALGANTTGSDNTAVGKNAGLALTTGSNNICIGSGTVGGAAESNTCRIGNGITTTIIAGIAGTDLAGTSTNVALINSSGKLGTDADTINIGTTANTAIVLDPAGSNLHAAGTQVDTTGNIGTVNSGRTKMIWATILEASAAVSISNQSGGITSLTRTGVGSYDIAFDAFGSIPTVCANPFTADYTIAITALSTSSATITIQDGSGALADTSLSLLLVGQA